MPGSYSLCDRHPDPAGLRIAFEQWQSGGVLGRLPSHRLTFMADEWGPLGALAGDWEGEGGLDSAFSHTADRVLETPYLEKLSFKPFGPVQNGDEALYGLDYRTAMWRGSEENPFHTEVGYWLWDAASGEVVRGFVVPRGITVLAGGTAAADATTFSLSAAAGDPRYGICSNQYLTENAATLSYRVTITAHADGTWSYDETSMLQMREMTEPFAHTDHNRLHRVG